MHIVRPDVNSKAVAGFSLMDLQLWSMQHYTTHLHVQATASAAEAAASMSCNMQRRCMVNMLGTDGKTEASSAYCGLMAHKHTCYRAVPDVPQPNGAITGAGGNIVTVGMPLHHIDI